MKKPWNKLIVALDLTSEKDLKRALRLLSPKIKKFKVGLIPYTKFGPQVIKWAKKYKVQVFLDFKLFDIPNTMVEVAKGLVDLGVWAFTVHIKAGQESLAILKKEMTKYARRKKKRVPLVIGVSELTSQKASKLKVLALAKVAKQAKIDGVVCSVWEAKAIKKNYNLLTITPGIRKKTCDDQRRVATVSDALREGVGYFVVGRPIVKKRNLLSAAEEIISS